MAWAFLCPDPHLGQQGQVLEGNSHLSIHIVPGGPPGATWGVTIVTQSYPPLHPC